MAGLSTQPPASMPASPAPVTGSTPTDQAAAAPAPPVPSLLTQEMSASPPEAAPALSISTSGANAGTSAPAGASTASVTPAASTATATPPAPSPAAAVLWDPFSEDGTAAAVRADVAALPGSLSAPSEDGCPLACGSGVTVGQTVLERGIWSREHTSLKKGTHPLRHFPLCQLARFTFRSRGAHSVADEDEEKGGEITTAIRAPVSKRPCALTRLVSSLSALVSLGVLRPFPAVNK